MVEVAFTDIERAVRDRDPQLADLLLRYLEQDDPAPGKAELPTADEVLRQSDDDYDYSDDEYPDGAFTIYKLRDAVSDSSMRGKTATERKLARRDAWQQAVASPYTPPRLRLGGLLLELYEAGDDAGRAVLIRVFERGHLGWGVWKAIKAIYKLAEARHDAAMLGVIGYRMDAMGSTTYHRSEIGAGTLVYLRRRVWRYLRGLGRAVPDAYPTYAVEVLRHYPDDFGGHNTSVVAAQIWAHQHMIGERGGHAFEPPDDLDARAFADTWKTSPAPLLRLLDQSDNNLVLDFAIRCLRGDHPLALRAVEPGWLARIGSRRHGALHLFVVKLLEDGPEFHQSKLRGLGLHDVVLGWLRSPENVARAYALAYAQAHAPDISIADLVALVEDDPAADVVEMATARLEAMSPQQLGIGVVLRLVVPDATRAMATAKFVHGFRPADITIEQFVDVALKIDGHDYANLDRAALIKLYGSATAIPAAYLLRLLADKRIDDQPLHQRFALGELGKRTAAEIGVAWIQRAIEDRKLSDTVARWFDGEMMVGDKLDVEWVKGLVAKPRLRALALKTLGNRRLITPSRIGLDWLLDLARSPDQTLQQFAQRLLLEHFAPEDFAGAGASREAGLERLWDLAAGKGRPEPVRVFGQTYLKAHHPDLGPNLAEAKALGIQPKLDHAAYPMARVRPLLDDDRADVRRLAAAITAEEVVRWGDPDVVYEIAGSAHREPRALGCELLLSLVDATPKLPAAWLDGRRLFALAESNHKGSREAALTLIRRAYDRVGGAERLAWLMESPDRDVRLFAVRLFWDRHRPRPVPDEWKPPKDVAAPLGGDRFASTSDLQQFLRAVMFGLPPGRLEKRDALPGGAMPERPLAASTAKRRIVDTVRALAIDDAEFARVLSPVLIEMSASVAKGEWQACVSALAAMRLAHPDLGNFGLPPASAGTRRQR